MDRPRRGQASSSAADAAAVPVQVAAVAAGLEPQPEAAVDDDLADEEEDEDLIHSAGGDTASEASAASSASDTDTAAAGRGRGKGGRGRGGARGRGRGKAQAAGRGKGDAAAAGAKPKHQWVDASEHDFTPRYEWDGEELPWLDNTFDGMTLQSAPHESNTPRVPCKRSLNLQPALESRRGSSDVAPHAQCGRLRGRASDVRGTNGRTHAAGMPSGNGGSRKACGDRPWVLPMRHVPEPSR